MRRSKFWISSENANVHGKMGTSHWILPCDRCPSPLLSTSLLHRVRFFPSSVLVCFCPAFSSFTMQTIPFSIEWIECISSSQWSMNMFAWRWAQRNTEDRTQQCNPFIETRQPTANNYRKHIDRTAYCVFAGLAMWRCVSEYCVWMWERVKAFSWIGFIFHVRRFDIETGIEPQSQMLFVRR